MQCGEKPAGRIDVHQGNARFSLHRICELYSSDAHHYAKRKVYSTITSFKTDASDPLFC